MNQDTQISRTPPPTASTTASVSRQTRRHFMRGLGLGGCSLLAARWPAMAGPFTREDFEHLVPADKKLRPEWLKSLFDRGTPEVLRGEDLRFVGMPVGGLCAGQLYLGGDGKLWLWDIFNRQIGTGDGHYANPPKPQSPVEQAFSLTIDGQPRVLDRSGFREVTFRGAYPIGVVEYRDPGAAAEVTLEAFSPFIPLNTEDSSLPATVLRYTVRNTSQRKLELELTGLLENAVCQGQQDRPGTRRLRRIAGEGFTFLECTVHQAEEPQGEARPELVIEDWSKDAYQDWRVEGTAFGSGPVRKTAIPQYQGDVGGDTERVVNSHATAPGNDTPSRDNATGKLTSRMFKLERHFLRLWVGGGDHAGRTCVNLLVDGKVVRSATGRRNNLMTLQSLDVRDWAGKEACLEIVDAQQGDWGNIGVGRITLADQPAAAPALEGLPDHGSMGLALLGKPADLCADALTAPLEARQTGSIGRKFSLEPGAAATVDFVLTWYFPNLQINGVRDTGRWYATKFGSALEVAAHVAKNFTRLSVETRLWLDTWYDSTLPYWFLDRTQLNTSILATSTCHRFRSGRFWAWEGVGCCHGTCGHVWQYAHAVARLFPDLERGLRERVDFGFALQPDGAIFFRGENNNIPAIDAQAGSILRALREHQMSANGAFLKKNWPGIRRATEWLIAKDGDGDGLIRSNQHNTLDADWFGPVAWLSGLYQAALLAAAAMADETGEAAFAATCRAIATKGQAMLVSELFDGEYFINRVDPAHANSINSGTGCEIDQVMGQSWAYQVGLPRVFPEQATRTALRSLWKYNFSPDVGPYRARYQTGRWYAMPGEAGLLMCTFPRKDWDYKQAQGGGDNTFAGYFNECMNGFEYQAAGHMLWEGLVQEGLAVTRAVHDRYHASRRNPWNEVECGDHYARSMASYGVYLAACGFENHGPNGHIGFAPRLTPDNFRGAFTAPEGWGTFSQHDTPAGRDARIALRWGTLRLKSLALELPNANKTPVLTVEMAGKRIEVKPELSARRLVLHLPQEVVLNAGEALEIRIR
ncbi:MAG: GH116 family glycosyl-hydrolase [Verrucomicrobia bacterium]|nr:GH116 family glycosyl-hydrolase [Verrucomicrobiota bacterium]